MPKQMPFGKHKGKLLTEVPAEYLKWVLETVDDLAPWLEKGIEKALSRPARIAPARPPVLPSAELTKIPTGFQKLPVDEDGWINKDDILPEVTLWLSMMQERQDASGKVTVQETHEALLEALGMDKYVPFVEEAVSNTP